MLGKFFGSSMRAKILKLLLLHPERSYYLKQLAKDLKLRPDSARRELENLEKVGLLTFENENEPTQAEERSWRANIDFPLYEEVRALILKSQVLYEKDLAAKLKKIGKVKLFILSGFFVNNRESLIDLLVVGKFGENRKKIIAMIKDVEKELGREINYTIMSPGEFKYRHEITDVFLYGLLEGKKIIAIDEMGIK